MQVRSGSPVVTGWSSTPQRVAHHVTSYEPPMKANAVRLQHQQQPQSPTSGCSLSFTSVPPQAAVLQAAAPAAPWPSGQQQQHFLPQGPCLQQQQQPGLAPTMRPWPQPPPMGGFGGFASPPVAPPSPSPAAVNGLGLACPSPLVVPGMPWPIH